MVLANAGIPASIPATAETAWVPKINTSKPSGPSPAGMIWIPGGQFWMGADDDHMPDTKPWHRVYVDGYWMDKTEITNEQFARFVKATGYVTVAEIKPRAEDYPQARPENLFPARSSSRRRITQSSSTITFSGGDMWAARTGAIRKVLAQTLRIG